MSAGVLNAEQVHKYLLSGDAPAIKTYGKSLIKPDASSIDLPLGETYWELKASVRPSRDQSVIDVLNQVEAVKKPLGTSTRLLKNHVYLVALAWPELQLPTGIYARATAKSSIGRLDVLVRLVTDKEPEFDRIRHQSHTRLYVEIVPLTFDIIVSPGTTLSQLRFIRGTDSMCIVSRQELEHEEQPVLVDKSGESSMSSSHGDDNSILLSLDASNDPAFGFAGFRALNCDGLEAINPSLRRPKNGEADQRPRPENYWEPVKGSDEPKGVLIEKDRFYILRSKERFRIPAHLAVECQAYAESLGDIRIHYAGFAHPGFGFDRKEGTPLIFEVRGFSMNTHLRDGAPLAKVQFRRMSVDADASSAEKTYGSQELNLSACFQDWATTPK